MDLFNCVDLRDKMEGQIKLYVDTCKDLGICRPTLGVITAGEEIANSSYVKSKKEACSRVGIVYQHVDLGENTWEEWVIKKVKELNDNKLVNGFIVQHPLVSYRKINMTKVLDAIKPIKDVDGLSPYSLGMLALNDAEPTFIPCTAKGVVDILRKQLNVSLKGKHVVIIGKGLTSGRPLSLLLPRYGATVSTIDSKTPYTLKRSLLYSADIVISCTGRPNSLSTQCLDYTKPVILINVGMNRLDGKLCGDIDINDLKEIEDLRSKELDYKVNTVTKSTGILTVTNLLYNTCLAHLLQDVPSEHFNKLADILDELH